MSEEETVYSYAQLGEEIVKNEWGKGFSGDIESAIKNLDVNTMTLSVLCAILKKLDGIKVIESEIKELRNNRFEKAYNDSFRLTIESLELKFGKMSAGLRKCIRERMSSRECKERYGYADGNWTFMCLPILCGPSKKSKYYSEWKKYCKGDFIRMKEVKP
jgi:hypothetical protein